MGEVLFILMALALYFLLGYFVGIRKYLKAISASLNYERELPTSDYQEGWLDCLGFILKQ
ncbi:hypothetical protein JFL35_15525 [Enterococcus faecalis]|uniref:Uncharacterized protein n=1 Tax=Enterococcus faecalis ERV63 TaxID=1134793 RepID=A0AAV3GHT7_ENTFL|nr:MULTISPECIES: hypothetical protein [Enterococcus]EJV12280.1 hypothetical protein HMPREF1336_03341 [Enterococcus faecalis ERV63]EJV24797.1 hypothetical protein HMPREF1339_02320 [Enterococcus faecalis ERV72]EJV34419.1 hypothetical protein HMPREF1340_00104 [Enterococcus faecalis ERV73]MBJ0383281.1 hypothetical protein [Enterococcus faecalis]MBJ0392730.1 hypothetical protein [Enterococcus faecalis]